jgi:hypothetical protein
VKKAPVNIDIGKMGKAVQAYVRSRAIRSGSFLIYQENNVIVKEDPRTGQKTVIPSSEKR